MGWLSPCALYNGESGKREGLVRGRRAAVDAGEKHNQRRGQRDDEHFEQGEPGIADRIGGALQRKQSAYQRRTIGEPEYQHR